MHADCRQLRRRSCRCSRAELSALRQPRRRTLTPAAVYADAQPRRRDTTGQSELRSR